jgi:hypothetical protein
MVQRGSAGGRPALWSNLCDETVQLSFVCVCVCVTSNAVVDRVVLCFVLVGDPDSGKALHGFIVFLSSSRKNIRLAAQIRPITVAARSKIWTVFARSNAGIVGSNPTQAMDVCVVLCVGSGLATGWSLVQGVLPTVYRINKLKNRPRSNKRTVEPYR